MPTPAAVDLSADPDTMRSSLVAVRVFAGYAGWSEGQLEGEIRRGDWFVVDAEARDAFTAEPDALWAIVLRRQRDSLAFVSLFPDDPAMN